MPDPRTRLHAIIREELAKPLHTLPELTDGIEIREDLGASMVDVVCLFIAIEEQFGIEISDADMENTVTVGELCALVERLVRKRAA